MYSHFGLIKPSAAATAAAVVVSCCHTAAAAVAAVAVTEEKNEDDEKAPIVIASATHDLTSPFCFKRFFNRLHSHLMWIRGKCYGISKKFRRGHHRLRRLFFCLVFEALHGSGDSAAS